MITLNKKIAAGIAGVTMAGAAFAAGPAFAQSDEGTDVTDDAVETERPGRGEALQALVDNGTISQEQMDSIVAQFEARRADGEGFRGPRGFRGGGSEVVTTLLGVEQDELREALQGGQTLAEVAVANGVAVDTLVDELVAEKNSRLDEKVADGTLTAEEADEKRADLEERITARVNGERPGDDAEEPA
ncbi:MAG: hypothetical protein ACR2O6_15520 [Ilumatobacteraceae bacterium]